MFVLKIIGGIILAVLALIVAVLCIKVRIFIEYSEVNTKVAIKWLFINIPVYPRPKAETANADASAQTPSQEVQPDIADDASENTEEATPTEETAADAQEVAAPKKDNFLKTLYHRDDSSLLKWNLHYVVLGYQNKGLIFLDYL